MCIMDVVRNKNKNRLISSNRLVWFFSIRIDCKQIKLQIDK